MVGKPTVRVRYPIVFSVRRVGLVMTSTKIGKIPKLTVFNNLLRYLLASLNGCLPLQASSSTCLEKYFEKSLFVCFINLVLLLFLFVI